jgi:riboflavin kinase/FMN adenylyltransferase
MKLVYYDKNDPVVMNDKPIVFALGKFESLHLGHQAVIKKAREIATEKKELLGIMIYPDGKDSILPLHLRLQLLNQYDPDFILIFEPTPSNYLVTAKEFMTQLKDR